MNAIKAIPKLILLTALIGIVSVLFSCRKSIEVISGPILPNPPADTSSYLQLAVTGVQPTGNSIFALLSMESNSGQPVMTNKKVTLRNEQGVYLTDAVALPKGDYTLTKLLVTTSSDTALYAAPKVNTAKASQVQAPLALPVAISKPAVNKTAVQVLGIGKQDQPESFGYTSEEFGFMSLLRLRTKISIRVGTVLYDSLSGKVTIDAVNAEGSHWKKELDLASGLGEISVPEKYASFSFEVQKWNAITKKTLSRQQLQQNMILEFNASRIPKRLVEEARFLEHTAGLIYDGRTEYQYQANNLLSAIRYYQKSTIESGLPLSMTDRFSYNGLVPDTIHRYDAKNTLTGYTAFVYSAGRISNIFNQTYGQHTGAAAAHAENGNDKTIVADYLLSNGNTMTYRMVYRDNNKMTTIVNTTTGAETVTFQYDENINPYYQLGYPDLYFSRTSKNNMTLDQHVYQGAIPTTVPYKYEYTYDADGYPSVLYVSYKGYTSGKHLFRMRTEYRYQ